MSQIHLLIAAIVLLSLPHARAEQFTIVNPGFETLLLADGEQSDNSLPGWQAVGIDDPEQFGGFNPTIAAFPAEAPQGLNVGYLRRGALFQILPEPIIGGAQVEVSFYVGDSLLLPFGPARVQLRIGQARFNMTGTPPSGQFQRFSSNFAIPPQYDGMPLELWIERLDDDDSSAFYVDEISIRTVPTSRCPFDITGNLQVDLSDLAVLLAHFGESEGASQATGDLDSDGDVDLNDLSLLLANFATSC